MKIFAKSRTIGLVVGLVLLVLILPGAVSAYSTSSVNARVISTTIPPSMIAGQSYPVSVTMKNTGSMTWNEASMIRFGAVGDGSGVAAQFGSVRVKIPAGTNVLPGAQYTFSFTMTAPSTTGYYTPKYRMIWEGHQWFGARASKTIQVVKLATVSTGVPVAQFTANATSGQAPLPVQFTGQSVVAGTISFAWDINNDGTVDYTTKSPAHTYQAAGNYTVNLTVTNASGSDSEIKTSYIKVSSAVVKPTPTPTVTPIGVAPKAQFTSNVTSGNTEMVAVQFTDQSTGTMPVTYHWDFADGNGNLPENSQKNPVWRFWQNVGTVYTVTLTVTNAYGSDTIVKPNYITLSTTAATVPVAAFTSSTQSGTAPLTVSFTDQSTGTPLTWAWDFNNDKITDSTQKSPSFTYASAGNYTVNLTVTNANGKDSEIKTSFIWVSAAGTTSTPTPTPSPTPTPAPTVASSKLPVAKFTANTTQGQAPLAVQFTDQSVITGITSYTWDINNDGVTEYTTKNPVHTYPTAGTYTVKHSVTNTSGSDSEIKTNYIQVSTLQSAECYGAEACNPTGNPIGGGAGYTNLISQTNPNVKYVVSTKDQLLTALKSAKSGEIIFVPETANIDMTGVYGTHIPAGVTLASNRGSNGSVGGRIFTGAGQPAGWGASISMLEINGNNVRITGLRLEGNEKSKVFTGYEGTFGVFSYGFTGVEIDNNEIWGFGQADVTVGMPNDAGSNTTQQAALAATEIGSTIMNVHHNYLHHSQIEAEGYGVNVVRGSALIKANLFDYTRHAIADDGFDWNGYEATYNVYIGSNAYSHIFDVHGQNGGMGGKAGNTYRIVHNTFLSNTSHAIFIRGVPLNNALITLNIMNNCYETTGDLCWGDPPNAVQQYNSVGNITMMNNIIDGKQVSGSQILKEIP